MADPSTKPDMLQSAEFIARYKGDTKWLLEPFAVDGSSIMIYGRQGSGKSTLAWQLAHSLSTGSPWIGFPVARPLKMCYLNLDMPYKEFWRLINRGTKDGFEPNGNIIVPNPEVFQDINVKKSQSYDYLRMMVQMYEIEGIVVDVISEAYIPAQSGDINMEARNVIKKLQRLVPNGILVFLQHVRKGSPYKKIDEGDPDNFLGAGAWEAAASTSLKIGKDKDDNVKLYAKKSRIDVAGFKELPLKLKAHGFFEADHGYGELLRTWPRLVPLEERFIPRTKKDVFEDIAKRCDTDPDTIRATFYRWRKAGVYFEWEEMLAESV